MKGSTRKRGATWTAYWFTADPGNGNGKQHSKGGFRTQRAAQEHLNETLGKVQTGNWAPDKKMTVQELLAEWLAAKKSEGLAPTTLAQYRNVVNSWLVPKIGALELRHLSPARAQELADTLRANGSALKRGALSPRSVQLAISVLKGSTAWAFETGLVGRDPLAGYRRPERNPTVSRGMPGPQTRQRDSSLTLPMIDSPSHGLSYSRAVCDGANWPASAGMLSTSMVQRCGSSARGSSLTLSPSCRRRRLRLAGAAFRWTPPLSGCSAPGRHARGRSGSRSVKAGGRVATCSLTRSADRCTRSISLRPWTHSPRRRGCVGFGSTTSATLPPLS
jgi:hypothetical protein